MLTTARVSTPSTLHSQHQRNGAIDPEVAQQACKQIVQNTPELIELCKQAQNTSDGGWLDTLANLPAGVVLPTLTGLSTLFVFRNNLTTFAANQTAKNKAAQKAIQDNLNILDLDMLEEVSKYCRENLKPLNWRKAQDRHMHMQEKFKTAIQGQLASGKNVRGSSVAKTAYANVTGLEIKSADAPAIYTTRPLKKLIKEIEESRVKIDALGRETKNADVVSTHRKKLEGNNLALRSTRVSRSSLLSLKKYRRQEEQAAVVKRAQLEGLRGVGSRLVDSDWRGAILKYARLHGAYLELMDLGLADLRLLNAPGATFKRCTLTDADAKGIKANGSHWGGVNGDYADFSFAYSTGEDPAYKFYKASDFKRATFYRVVTDPITFTLTPVTNSFDGADFRGAQFQHAQLLDFSACWANFSPPVWKPSQVPAGVLPDYMYTEHPEWAAYHKPPVDFSHARMAKVNLEGSDLTGAQFRDVKTEAKRETVPVIKPLGEVALKEQNEISTEMAPWINRYDEPCNPVNLKKAILKKTVWDDTLVNRVKFKTEAELQPSFDFQGAFVDDADFRKARLQVVGTNAIISVENAAQQVAQGENILLKLQLKALFDGMHYEHNKPKFHSDETINKTFTGKIISLTQGEPKND